MKNKKFKDGLKGISLRLSEEELTNIDTISVNRDIYNRSETIRYIINMLFHDKEIRYILDKKTEAFKNFQIKNTAEIVRLKNKIFQDNYNIQSFSLLLQDIRSKLYNSGFKDFKRIVKDILHMYNLRFKDNPESETLEQCVLFLKDVNEANSFGEVTRVFEDVMLFKKEYYKGNVDSFEEYKKNTEYKKLSQKEAIKLISGTDYIEPLGDKVEKIERDKDGHYFAYTADGSKTELDEDSLSNKEISELESGSSKAPVFVDKKYDMSLINSWYNNSIIKNALTYYSYDRELQRITFGMDMTKKGVFRHHYCNEEKDLIKFINGAELNKYRSNFYISVAKSSDAIKLNTQNSEDRKSHIPEFILSFKKNVYRYDTLIDLDFKNDKHDFNKFVNSVKNAFEILKKNNVLFYLIFSGRGFQFNIKENLILPNNDKDFKRFKIAYNKYCTELSKMLSLEEYFDVKVSSGDYMQMQKLPYTLANIDIDKMTANLVLLINDIKDFETKLRLNIFDFSDVSAVNKFIDNLKIETDLEKYNAYKQHDFLKKIAPDFTKIKDEEIIRKFDIPEDINNEKKEDYEHFEIL